MLAERSSVTRQPMPSGPVGWEREGVVGQGLGGKHTQHLYFTCVIWHTHVLHTRGTHLPVQVCPRKVEVVQQGRGAEAEARPCQMRHATPQAVPAEL